MHFTARKRSLLILAITSIVFSRAIFFFFNDPEGPNLLVVTVMAVLFYILSLILFIAVSSVLPVAGLKRLLLVILIQILLAVGLYLLLR